MIISPDVPRTSFQPTTFQPTTGAFEPTRLSVRRHQLHFWIGEREYQFLCSVAEIDEEPISVVLRRTIRQLMLQKRYSIDVTPNT
jgi:hypothetical protein